MMMEKLTRAGIWTEITNVKFSGAWMAAQYCCFLKNEKLSSWFLLTFSSPALFVATQALSNIQ